MAKPRIPMGMGGANMNNMIKQAQKMQQNMLKMQEEMEQQEFEASAGGGAVTVKMSGKKELTAVSIKPEVLDPDDVEMLEDLVLTAVNDVLAQVDSANASKMSAITGGFNLPGMF